jgi:hypothetical protein
MSDQKENTSYGLTREEQEYLRGTIARPRRVERRRPGWLVVGMVWATLGLYTVIWVGLHWAEMKRQLKDERMYPIWHSLALLVPIYNFFRFHSNFRVLNELLSTTSTSHRAQPLLAVMTYVLATALMFVTQEAGLEMPLAGVNAMAAVAAISWTIYHGQTGMNAYWDAVSNVTVDTSVKLWERILLAVGAAIWSVFLLGLLAELAGIT